jgi:hypothetical protein
MRQSIIGGVIGGCLVLLLVVAVLVVVGPVSPAVSGLVPRTEQRSGGYDTTGADKQMEQIRESICHKSIQNNQNAGTLTYNDPSCR